MASTSESTFGNRLEHARNLQVVLGKITGYAPANGALKPAAFQSFLDTVEAANNDVAGTGQVLSDARKARRLAFFGQAKQDVPGLSTLAGRVRDNVGSMDGGKKSPSYARIQKLTQKISNYHAPAKPVSPSPGTTPTEQKRISQSEASYGSLVQAGRDLAAAVAKVPGYNPNSPDLTPAALVAAMQNLENQNEAVAEALMEAQQAIDRRARLYDDPETGLASVFQAAKAAVASQFGRRSEEYRLVSSIRY
ncbi:MAG: hypothetical protein M3Y80_12050 [Verrucomicrobiota bacterium]|nr:hypothetical protein [Verrucomicrobiota bacterium]